MKVKKVHTLPSRTVGMWCVITRGVRVDIFFTFCSYSRVPNCRGGAIKEGGVEKWAKNSWKFLKLSMGGM